MQLVAERWREIDLWEKLLGETRYPSLETGITNARGTERFGDQHRASITLWISSGTAKTTAALSPNMPTTRPRTLSMSGYGFASKDQIAPWGRIHLRYRTIGINRHKEVSRGIFRADKVHKGLSASCSEENDLIPPRCATLHSR